MHLQRTRFSLNIVQLGNSERVGCITFPRSVSYPGMKLTVNRGAPILDFWAL
jgi:hypothetical protein